MIPAPRLRRALPALLPLLAVGVWALVAARAAAGPPHSNGLEVRAAQRTGLPTAAIQAVYFHRPSCPYCAELGPRLQRLVDEHPEAVAVRAVVVPASGSVEHAMAHACAADPAGCSSDALRRAVAADLALAERLGVTEVPDLRLGTLRVVGAVGYAALDSALHAQTGTAH